MKKAFTLFAIIAAMTLVWTSGAWTSGAWAAGMMAHDSKIGDIEIVQPWARVSAGKTGAAYLTLVNGGAGEDRLVAVRSSVARKTGLHQSLMEDGIMKMQPVKAIALPPGGTVALKPGGYHVMFMGLKAPFREGDVVALTLVFEKAGEIEIMVPVRKAGAMQMNHAN